MPDAAQTSIREAVIRASDGTETTEEAARRLLEIAAGDPSLYARIVGPFELPAAVQAVRDYAQEKRAVIWSRPSAPDGRAAALAAVNTMTLMHFPLPGGKTLGEATKDDVSSAAAFYARQAADMAWKGRWLDAVAKKTPKGKTVREAMTDATLADLQEKTK